MNQPFDRRALLQAAACLPFAGALRAAAAWLPRGDARTLLVLELEGGNDGLNTVIPVDDARYAKARPTLQVVRAGAHALGQGQALHGALAQLAVRVTSGSAAVVHGVGYPRPDRSHFRSRDVWHTADPALPIVRADTTGWLGRVADQHAAAGAGLPAAAIGGTEVALLLRSKAVVVPCLRRIEDFQLQTGGSGDAASAHRAALRELLAPRTDGALLGDLARIASAAVDQSERLRAALQRYAPKADYPPTPLGRDLQLCARMAIAGFGTRLFHVRFGGFDTHARQLPTQQSLLQQLDGALAAFADDLAGHGALATTTVLVHSEFGRRVAENQSQGTDHGAAAPVFVLGGGVRGGQHGAPPDLADLDDGDVKPTTDFRAVYRDLLDWLGVAAKPVLGGEFAGVGLFAL